MVNHSEWPSGVRKRKSCATRLAPLDHAVERRTERAVSRVDDIHPLRRRPLVAALTRVGFGFRLVNTLSAATSQSQIRSAGAVSASAALDIGDDALRGGRREGVC